MRHKESSSTTLIPRFISIDVEASSLCSNACAMCPGEGVSRPGGMMSTETFRNLMDFITGSRCLITFSGMGDPLCNPDLGRYIRCASEAGHETGVVVHPASLKRGISGNTGLERLVRQPPHTITVSFPTTRKDVFQRLSPAISMEQALDITMTLARNVPGRVRTAGIITGLNSDEEHEYREFWQRYGIPSWVTPCHSRGGNLKADYLVIAERSKGLGKEGACALFTFHTFITWEGKILACCHDLSGSTCMGNVRALRGYPSLMTKKRRIAAKTPCPDFPLCTRCDEPLRNIHTGRLPPEGDVRERKSFFARMARGAGRSDGLSRKAGLR